MYTNHRKSDENRNDDMRGHFFAILRPIQRKPPPQASVRRVVESIVHIGLTVLIQLTDTFGVHTSLYCPDHFDRWPGNFMRPNHYFPSWQMEHRSGYIRALFVDFLRYCRC